MVRLLVYANEFELEGLIASASGTPGELKEAVVRPDLLTELVSAYGEVLPQLSQRASGWPAAELLQRRIKRGNPRRGRDHVGEGHDTEGSRWIIDRVDSGTPEHPLNISIWGGQTDLAQALWRIRHDRGESGLTSFVRRFRVYDIDDQDQIADWMRGEFPGMFYILSKAPLGQDRRQSAYRGIYLGGDESLTGLTWVEANVLNKGALGRLYPTKTWTKPNAHGCMKEGDTPSWLFFLPAGGNDPSDPTKPGWGGQFRQAPDGWFRDRLAAEGFDPRETISCWRPELQRDFARRMTWCVPE
jgi:hypothetical protein